ncbi:phosphatase PAP2 family protein [Rhizobium sp. SG741]|uniref:phosphatase PAP2 family protein n=1 Tax=Rhizobium sp. SG741 TaxID=2587114 RepID=UPI0014481A60|nr:phosphatase PAP2 family protein [Rhizobium sp. SG741]NKJ04472.1 membrane-associated phospholipid phosphatase [Rhizobium sp. SG741]
MKKTLATATDTCRARCINGLRRFFAAPTLTPPANRAFLERPIVIISIFLALSLLVMITADYPLGVWMKSFPEQLRGTAKWISSFGTGLLVLSFSGALLIFAILAPAHKLRKSARTGADLVATAAAFVFLSVAGGGLVDSLAKNIIGRARPELLQTNGAFYFRPVAFHADFASFPSGHSATAGAMAMSLALVFPRLRPIFMPAGVLICLSRQWVGAHWASDTLMGWGVGIAFALWLAHAFARRRLLFTYGSDGRLCPGERYKTVLMTLRALLRRRPVTAKEEATSAPATACPSQSNLASHTLEIRS